MNFKFTIIVSVIFSTVTMIFFQIAGATGTGKTEVVMSLTKHNKLHIINCDSVQVYNSLNISSNKTEHKTTHNLLDIADFKNPYDVDKFVIDFEKEMKIAALHNKIPVLVGGTGLYFSRINVPKFCTSVYKFFLVQNRERLYRKLDMRCEKMNLDGMLNEIIDLKTQGLHVDNVLGRSIGCRDALILFDALGEDHNTNKMQFNIFLETFKRRTRNYVRKQECWFKNSDFTWVDIDSNNCIKIIQDLIDKKDVDLAPIHKKSYLINYNATKKMKEYRSINTRIDDTKIDEILLSVIERLKMRKFIV